MPSTPKSLVVATRIHLGNAADKPSTERLQATVDSLLFFGKSINATKTIIAADATPKFDGYDLIEVLQSMIASTNIILIPVTPWNNFVPALNAILSEASGAHYCLMVSAETFVSPAHVGLLLNHFHDNNTLVVGAVLPGHDYHPQSTQALNGRTTPWNTLCVWNVAMVSLTGFALVADGVHPNENGSPGVSGVEEVSTIAVLQRILDAEHAKAKLVPLDDVKWETDFVDEERQSWHERKMNSKVQRSARHLELLNLNGIVQHL